MDLKAFYEEYRGVPCSYKFTNGFIAGYKDEWLIIGYRSDVGCIATFTDHVVYDNSYMSYRFADPHKTAINISDVKVNLTIQNNDTSI